MNIVAAIAILAVIVAAAFAFFSDIKKSTNTRNEALITQAASDHCSWSTHALCPLLSQRKTYN